MQQYQPIYNVDCAECDWTTCVGLVDEDGQVTCTNLCGWHFFADKSMQDPDLWNDLREATE